MGKKSISAKAVVEDVRMGIDRFELMRRHELSPSQLDKVLNKLVQMGLLSQIDLAEEAPAPKERPPFDYSAPSATHDPVRDSYIKERTLPLGRPEVKEDTRSWGLLIGIGLALVLMIAVGLMLWSRSNIERGVRPGMSQAALLDRVGSTGMVGPAIVEQSSLKKYNFLLQRRGGPVTVVGPYSDDGFSEFESYSKIWVFMKLHSIVVEQVPRLTAAAAAST